MHTRGGLQRLIRNSAPMLAIATCLAARMYVYAFQHVRIPCSLFWHIQVAALRDAGVLSAKGVDASPLAYPGLNQHFLDDDNEADDTASNHSGAARSMVGREGGLLLSSCAACGTARVCTRVHVRACSLFLHASLHTPATHVCIGRESRTARLQQ